MPEVFDRLKTALADRYTIERELGAGGMATVYLAEDLKHHRKVAVKVLRPELAAILGPERFLNEIEVTANLQHPHILPLYDSGEADSFLYYVMPHVEGESLREKLNREKQLSVDEAIEIATSVASALDFAHQHSVVHRDIKPDNILLQAGQALVADFGIALAISAAGGTRLTETGLSLGTPHYMSPEQATADRELDARSDVYSLGAVVYEMLVGEPPHVGNSAQAIVAKILSDTPTPITRTRELVPANVDAAVCCALTKSPADRFSSAAEFSAALTNPAFTLPTTGTTVAVGGQMVGAWKRLSLGMTSVAIVLAILTLWSWLRAGDAVDTTVRRYRIVLPEENRFLYSGSAITMSPDGSSIVYVGPAESGRQLWLKSSDQLTAQPLLGTETALGPSFSPDGQRVAFYASPLQLKVASLGGQPPITLVDSGMSSTQISWGFDGYVYGEAGSVAGFGLVRVPETGGALEQVTTPDSSANELYHYNPVPLPNGKGVLYGVVHLDSDIAETDIAVLDLESGEQEILVRGFMATYSPTGHLVYVRADGVLMAVPFDQARLRIAGAAVPLFEGVRIKGTGWDLALSASGALIYASGSASSDAPYGKGTPMWVNRAGQATPVDATWVLDLPFNKSLALSPDGRRLAIDIWGEIADIWIKQLDDGPLTRLTFDNREDTGISWTPDGRSVTFSSNRDGLHGLYQKRADGAGSAELLLAPFGHGSIYQGLWDGDGRWLALRTGGQTNTRDMWGFRPGVDSMPERLLQNEYDELHLDLSPDGRWLAYTSTESGQAEVYVRRFPESGQGRYQVSAGGGTEPLWAHSGREIFYIDGDGQVVAAEVVTSPDFEVRERVVLFDPSGWRVGSPKRTYYDVSPDDQRFIMVRNVGGMDDAEIILIENFFEELRRKVGNE